MTSDSPALIVRLLSKKGIIPSSVENLGAEVFREYSATAISEFMHPSIIAIALTVAGLVIVKGPL